MSGESSNPAKKHGFESNRLNCDDRSELADKIERSANRLRHTAQFGDPRVINLYEKSFREIISRFKGDLITLLRDFGDPISVRVICVKTGYPKEIVGDMLRYLGEEVELNQKGEVICCY